ncbi:flagellar assembly protein FliX [Pelagibacterium montanilacus]|uniref:flagellar assembly protein FliX n=1 Tax=Pelagibacterium montanilacus TaxID=2185280 RepID=UPI000F8D6B86|nr:flagellar assembly protein FliX [Pelagibacterium montanilacus]
MRIDGTGRSVPAGTARRSSQSGSSASQAFSLDTPARPERAGGAHAPAPAAGIDALIALQSVDDATTGRRKAVRRAGQLLDTLEDIRADLLGGAVSEGRLHRAVSLLTQARSRTEPGLEALVADIELRVRVELAKLGHFPAF